MVYSIHSLTGGFEIVWIEDGLKTGVIDRYEKEISDCLSYWKIEGGSISALKVDGVNFDTYFEDFHNLFEKSKRYPISQIVGFMILVGEDGRVQKFEAEDGSYSRVEARF